MNNFKAVAEISMEASGATEQEAKRAAEYHFYNRIEKDAGNKGFSYEGVVRIEDIEEEEDGT